MEHEHAVQVAELDDPPNTGFGHDQPEIAVEQPHPLERADQHTEAERVDIVDPGQVEDQVGVAGTDLAEHLLAQFGRADHVELTGQGEHRPASGPVGVHDDVHPADRTGRHACDSVTGVP